MARGSNAIAKDVKDPKSDKKIPLSITKENISDFRNVISNNIAADPQDRVAIIAVIKFEKEFLGKIYQIQKERDQLKANESKGRV